MIKSSIPVTISSYLISKIVLGFYCFWSDWSLNGLTFFCFGFQQSSTRWSRWSFLRRFTGRLSFFRTVCFRFIFCFWARTLGFRILRCFSITLCTWRRVSFFCWIIGTRWLITCLRTIFTISIFIRISQIHLFFTRSILMPLCRKPNGMNLPKLLFVIQFRHVSLSF